MRINATTRWAIFAVVVLLGAQALFLGAKRLKPPWVHDRDFVQEYLLGKAILGGFNPYLDLPELAGRVFGQSDSHLPHPTPHAPFVAVLSAPLALLPFGTASTVWFCFELACVALSLRILFRELAVPLPLWMPIPLTLAFLNFTPIMDSIDWGQLSTLLFLLFVIAWVALRQGRDFAGGACLGLMLSIKPIFWPVLLLLLLTKRWQAILGAIVIGATANLAAVTCMGMDAFLDYYLRVGAEVYPLYRGAHSNLSLGSIGWRLFEGTRGPDAMFWVAPPLVPAPALAPWTATFWSLAVLLLGVWLARRKKEFDAQFSIFLILSIVLSPIAWQHYLVWTIIPLFILWTRLARAGFTPKPTLTLLAVTLLIRTPVSMIELPFGGILLGQTEPLTTGFWPATLTLFPLASCLALLWLVWKSPDPAPTGNQRQSPLDLAMPTTAS